MLFCFSIDLHGRQGEGPGQGTAPVQATKHAGGSGDAFRDDGGRPVRLLRWNMVRKPERDEPVSGNAVVAPVARGKTAALQGARPLDLTIPVFVR